MKYTANYKYLGCKECPEDINNGYGIFHIGITPEGDIVHYITTNIETHYHPFYNPKYGKTDTPYMQKCIKFANDMYCNYIFDNIVGSL